MYKFIKKEIIFIILIIIFSPNYFIFGAQTDTKESLSIKINDITAQIQLLDNEIKKYQDQISATNQQSQTLSNLIKELTLTRNKLLKETNQTSKKIELAKSTIANLEGDIGEKNNEISTTRSALKKSFYDMYQDNQKSIVEQVLLKNSIKNISQEYLYRVALNSKITSFIKKTQFIKNELESTKIKKELEKANLNLLKNKLDSQKKAVEITKEEKDKILKETKNKESEYRKILAEEQKKRDAFEKEISDYEAQIKFLLNPNLLPSIGSGALSWPLEKTFITQLFGKTSTSGRLYASGSHSGVDFRASIGTEVYAMASGKVLGTGNTDIYCNRASFGKWVFIQYNNGLSSTYGHLSSIIAKSGQEVKTGDIIGLSGNTGHSTGPHLHISVYASQGAQITEFPSKSCPGANFVMPVAPITAYLDPMLYLPQANKDILKKDNARD